MSTKDRIISPSEVNNDRAFDLSLRPKFSEYIGQESVKTNLNITIKAALKRQETIDHVLFMELRVWERQPWLMF